MYRKVRLAVAAYAKKQELRLKSSSGAVFSLLAENILWRGGVIYGVSMTSDCLGAEFLRVDKACDLDKLRGSKYIQAKMGDTFRSVKRDLANGLQVMFTGTGCQINALKCFLGKDYDNLLMVDIVCHGVPSPLLWKNYINYFEEKNHTKIISVSFRCKDNSWNDYGIKEIDKNHKETFISKEKDPYLLMFLRDYCLRPACYECHARENRSSDITLADFWGINRVDRKMNDGYGISLVLVRTPTGMGIWEKIRDQTVYKEISYTEGVLHNKAEYSSTVRPPEREDFYQKLSLEGFEKLAEEYAKPSGVSLYVRAKKALRRMTWKKR